VTDTKSELVSELMRHYKWYARSSTIYSVFFNILSILTIILSVVTSVLAAYSLEQLHWLVVLLPILTASFAAVLSQWNIKENWQLREDGRIQVSRILAEARALDTDDAAELRNEALRLRMAAFQIESEQSRGFFSNRTITKDNGQPPVPPSDKAPS
jgi:hypothetical protein